MSIVAEQVRNIKGRQIQSGSGAPTRSASVQNNSNYAPISSNTHSRSAGAVATAGGAGGVGVMIMMTDVITVETIIEGIAEPMDEAIGEEVGIFEEELIMQGQIVVEVQDEGFSEVIIVMGKLSTIQQ